MLVLTAVWLAVAAAASAAGYSDGCTDANLLLVENSADSGDGSLRSAIEAANARPGLDCIRFSLAPDDCVIHLASMLPVISDTVDIDCSAHDQKVQLDGSLSNISCRDAGSVLAFLTLGDPDGATFNSAAGSAVRNCAFSNGAQNKNNLRGPREPGNGPCAAIDAYFTSGVTLENNDISGVHGGYEGSHGIGLLLGEHHRVRNNAFESTHRAIELSLVTFSEVSGNQLLAGYPGDAETERSYPQSAGVAYVLSFYNLIEDNTVHGFDFGSLGLLSSGNVIKRNHLDCPVRVGHGAAAGTSDAFLDNVVVGGESSFVFASVEGSEPPRDNPVISNVMALPATVGISNTWDLSGDDRAKLTPNDNCDGDDGAQHLQNHPDVWDATIDIAGGAMWANGVLNSTAESNFLIQCYASNKPQRSGPYLLQNVFVSTNENCVAEFCCDCADHPAADSGVAQCKSAVGSLDASKPHYLGATATRCYDEPPTCASKSQLLATADQRALIDLDSGVLSSASMLLSSARQRRNARGVLASLSKKRSALAKSDKTEEHFAICETGQPVCVHARCPPACVAETIETGKGHFKYVEQKWHAVCPDGEVPYCLGSTSEISHMERATPPLVGKHAGVAVASSAASAAAIGATFALVLAALV